MKIDGTKQNWVAGRAKCLGVQSGRGHDFYVGRKHTALELDRLARQQNKLNRKQRKALERATRK